MKQETKKKAVLAYSTRLTRFENQNLKRDKKVIEKNKKNQ